MPLNLASPGILVREVDLTIGNVDPTTDKIGGIVGPYEKGPVDVPTSVVNEDDLVNKFGQPYDTDKQYETWMVGSSYLAYGGQLSVIRADDAGLKNANSEGNSIKIKSVDHYDDLGYADNPLPGTTVAAKNPGSWANGLRVGIIDALADQIIPLGSVSGLSVGMGVTQTPPVGTVRQTGAGTTELMDGYFKGIITKVNTESVGNVVGPSVEVKFLSNVSAGNTEYAYDYNNTYKFNQTNGSGTNTIDFPNSGAGTTSATISRAFGGTTAVQQTAGFAVTSFFNNSSGVLDQAGDAPLTTGATEIGIATAGLSGVVGANKFIGIGTEIIDATGASIGLGKITGLSRGSQGTSALQHADGSTVKFLTKNADVGEVTTTISSSAGSVGITTTVDISSKVNGGSILQFPAGELASVSVFFNGDSSSTSISSNVFDWFDQQELAISSATVGGTETLTTVKWNTVADKPGTSDFAESRGGRFDEVHVVVIDAEGEITGNSGTILEKHLNLSKAKDAEFSVGSRSYWRTWLETNSNNIFGTSGDVIGVTTTGFSSGFTQFGDGGWDQNAEGIIFNASGKQDLKLSGGLNYGGVGLITSTGALDSGVDDLIGGYGKFENDTTVDVDFLLMGSGKYPEDRTRALATKLIAVADIRKDAVAFISPHRGSMISDTSDQTAATILSDDQITENVVNFFSPITSSSFAVFDSGYKYMYDRFNDKFRYVPLNGDIAGTCARTDINDFPWFSPAGTDRGAILNAVKLPYNPTKLQRDKLYSNRINPVIFSPGSGIILFGDKTGFAKRSAFDRINVRRLFIFLEDAISAAAKDQLFEFNDEITRANFVNIIEPFLRDVQAKRGIQDYVVICDETNNTAAIIDSNEFVADIYVKPARSINFIGLTFIATRSGVSFEEVIGSV
tara:strand:+ start:2573 stop:5287 length:2715 start_codon:yes stop_codon:yes gene_type:complete